MAAEARENTKQYKKTKQKKKTPGHLKPKHLQSRCSRVIYDELHQDPERAAKPSQGYLNGKALPKGPAHSLARAHAQDTLTKAHVYSSYFCKLQGST